MNSYDSRIRRVLVLDPISVLSNFCGSSFVCQASFLLTQVRVRRALFHKWWISN